MGKPSVGSGGNPICADEGVAATSTATNTSLRTIVSMHQR
jgi:hypothetical protein